ncbi:DUF4142 domain-containing protein [Herbaspirillum sp. GCM10030257]|uniref:DUF4142 domain-containing protein n=1 Tax=Herbaspirillum sp. GCM10030257 TaxID=3273393 RepID=UPI0036145DF9
MMKRISVLALAMSLAACGGSDGDGGIIAGGTGGSSTLLQTTDTSGAGLGGTVTTPATPATSATGASPAVGTPAGASPAATPSAMTTLVPAATTTATAAATAFFTAAYQDGLAEIRLAQLAQTRAQSSGVKEYASRMIEQHTIVNSQIQQLAQQKNVTLPTDISTEQSAEITRLSALTGEQFDRDYMWQNVVTHSADVAEAMRQARTGDDLDARYLAAISAPLLKTHLAFGEDLLQRLDPAAFVAFTYQSSLAEVEWAQVALERATDEDVRRFAQSMVDEHTAANARIATFSGDKELPLPTAINPEQQAIAEDLARFSGADFDRAYMDVNVIAHAKAVRFARTQMTGDGRDVDVRGLARSLEPDLAGHLFRASELARNITPSFLYSAAQFNLAEIRLAYLGALASTDASIRAYGQRMVSEHTPVQLQIEQLAQANGVILPIELSPEQQLAYSALVVAQGQTFDAGFAAYNERLHDKAIERFTEEIQRPTNPQAQGFAQSLLPTLTAHRDDARVLLRGLGGQVLTLLQQVQALRDAL